MTLTPFSLSFLCLLLLLALSPHRAAADPRDLEVTRSLEAEDFAVTLAALLRDRTQYPVGSRERVTIETHIADAYTRLSRYREALDIVAAIGANDQAVVESSDRRAAANFLRVRGELASRLGRFGDADRDCAAALALLPAGLDAADIRWYAALANRCRAFAQVQMGRFAAAGEALAAADGRLTGSDPAERRFRAAVARVRGEYEAKARGNMAGAQQSVSLSQELCGRSPNSLCLAETLSYQAYLALFAHDTRRSRLLAQRAANMARQVASGPHAVEVQALLASAGAGLQDGDYAGVIVATDRGLALLATIYPASHPLQADMYETRGLALGGIGDQDASIAAMETAVSIRLGIFQRSHRTVVDALRNYAAALRRGGRAGEAATAERQAAEIEAGLRRDR